MRPLPAVRTEVETPSPRVPLVVDLDGTLVRTDTLHECLLLLVKKSLASLLLIPLWLLHGRARLKAELARRVELDVAHLPYCTELLAFLVEEKRGGRELVLATAADQRIAQAVATHLGLFSAVHASDGETNLSGPRKLRRVREALAGPFDYAGNAREDVVLWREARRALVVQARPAVLRQARAACGDVRQLAPRASPGLKTLARALRVHQWVKNVLLFVPLLAAHRALEPARLGQALEAFAAFCLCASSVYLLNDLLDLPSDRRHPTKRLRPFASGELPPRTGLLLAPALLALSLIVAWHVSSAFLGLLLAYQITTLAYSLVLKQVVVLDVMVLSGLYTLRLLAGSVATRIPTSGWLASFAMFFFLSLALVKRASELRRLRTTQRDTAAHGRGYEAGDYEQLGSLGTASAYLSVLVLALYISSSEVTVLYHHAGWLWCLCPLMLYWVTRVWVLVHRGAIDEDPILFALKDRVSYGVGGLALGILYLAAGR